MHRARSLSDFAAIQISIRYLECLLCWQQFSRRGLGKTDARIIVTQVVPSPFSDSTPIVREYQADLKAADPSAVASFGDLEGYIAARILTLALGKIEGPITRETVVDALEGLGEFDLGLGEPLRLSRTEHQASHHVWPSLLKGGRFVPFQWSDIGALLSGEPPR